jgi:uncharacterized Zn finger protein
MPSATKKRSRYDCPACGEQVKKLIRDASFFSTTSHCPNCGARISSDFFNNIPIFWFALLVAGQ